ncbi:MAG: helix-turn-helix transcriptional regulator [Crocinitomicaceae bacterium]|nr:helix-turn-helix transcriptional regulator [Crocinitomicaceae bacterium]
MRVDHQTRIFEIIKSLTEGQDSLGNIVGELLSISPDAVYRRYRGETQLTIFELEKLSKHFGISLDALFEIKKNTVVFDFQPLQMYENNMTEYLSKMHDRLKLIKAQKNPELIITINNSPMLQLLNFPHLVRFKLWFWGKTHLQMEEFQGKQFEYQKLPEETFAIGQEVLRIYNSIPSKEIYDGSFLRGFAREIYYYFNAHQFKDPGYAVYLLELLLRFVDHLENQAAIGKKFTFGIQPPASGNDFTMFHNETLNGNGTTVYKTDDHRGLYITHNLLNYIHTNDKVYFEDTMNVLNKQMANSSIISSNNEKARNDYFFHVKKMIIKLKSKMEIELVED